jgi:serine protease Do
MADLLHCIKNDAARPPPEQLTSSAHHNQRCYLCLERNLRRTLVSNACFWTSPWRKKLKNYAIAFGFATAVAVAALGFVYADQAGYSAFPEAHASTVENPAVTPSGLPDFTQLVVSEGPAVVDISVTERAPKVSAQQMPFQPGDPMYEFFRRFQMPMPEMQPTPRQGLGSGFVISQDGYILTNAHVVNNATDVLVKFTDKREFKAKVVGIDTRTDVALIKVDAKGLPVVKIGDPDKLKVGQWVAAIGAPFGLENTVTAGIVSAKSRSLPDGSYVPFIQTDVAINPGNSGGPLFTLNGDVVGINSQIYSRTGGYMGLSFSIPIDVAMKVAKDLQKYGKVERGRIGVSIQSLNPALAKSFGLDKSQGALVASVDPDSPAAKAGLKSGDIILSADGKTIDETADLPRIVGNTPPGQSIAMQVWRNGKSKNVRVNVERLKEDQADKEASAAQDQGPTLGIGVRTLTAQEKREADVDHGVLVEQISDGPVARAGIQPGDIILAINNDPVRSVDQIKDLLKRKKTVALLIQREDSRLYLPLKPAED